MTAFLFDEDHPDLNTFYGPQCACFIISALERLPSLPAFRINYGSLLHTRYCYRIDKVELRRTHTDESGFSSTSSSNLLKPTYDQFLTIICDLAETMSASGSSMNESALQNALAKKNIWVVVVQGLPNDYLDDVAAELGSFGAFLGWVKIDWNNPVHFDLFSTCLFKDMFIDQNGISKSIDDDDEHESGLEISNVLRTYGSKFEPKLLDHKTFSQRAPKLFSIGEQNDRALLSAQRIAGEMPNHRAKIGKALAGDFNAAGNFRTFLTSKPEDGIEFIVPEEKLRKYLLKIDHPHGGAKAKFFRDKLGIIQDDWRYLADQFCQAALNSDFYRLDVTEYGVMHGAQIVIIGRNGQRAVVESGWKLDDAGPAQFVTAYPGDESKLGELSVFPGRVPELSCAEPERWRRIHEMAHHCGMQRGERKIPTPMVLEGWGTIWDGSCGFGWVFLPTARSRFAKWALGQGIGYAAHPGLCISSKLQSQSIEKNLAYAMGYAEVLKANGIECRTDSRFD